MDAQQNKNEIFLKAGGFKTLKEYITNKQNKEYQNKLSLNNIFFEKFRIYLNANIKSMEGNTSGSVIENNNQQLQNMKYSAINFSENPKGESQNTGSNNTNKEKEKVMLTHLEQDNTKIKENRMKLKNFFEEKIDYSSKKKMLEQEQRRQQQIQLVQQQTRQRTQQPAQSQQEQEKQLKLEQERKRKEQQSANEEKKEEGLSRLMNIVFFYIITMLKISFFPITFLYYRYVYKESFDEIFKLMIRHSIPLFYYREVKNHRNVANANNHFFSTDYFVVQEQNKPDSKKPHAITQQEQSPSTNRNLLVETASQQNMKYKISFNMNSNWPYFIAFMVALLLVGGILLNLIGLIELQSINERIYIDLFGINFIILFYLSMNICTNVYISLRGNHTKIKSEKDELFNLIKSEEVQHEKLYMNFLIEPIDYNLMENIQQYGEAFKSVMEQSNKTNSASSTIQRTNTQNINSINNNQIQKNSSDNNSNPQKNNQKQKVEIAQTIAQNNNNDDELIYQKDNISGIGILTQYLLQIDRNSIYVLPYIPKNYLKFIQSFCKGSHSKNLGNYIQFFFNYLFFPPILIYLMIELTYRCVDSLRNDYSNEVGKISILVTLWICLILYLFVQFNNRLVKRTFQSRLYALERLSLMISFNSSIDYVRARKHMPTIDIFNIQSMQCWYDLRTLAMNYKINSHFGWLTLLMIEFSLIVVESLSQFFDSEGEFSIQLPKMDTYMRYLLIAGFVQRITTFILPSLIQQSQINYQYKLNRKQLSDHLFKIKQLQLDLDSQPELDEQFETIKNDVNYFGITMEIFKFEANKSIERSITLNRKNKKNESQQPKMNEKNESQQSKMNEKEMMNKEKSNYLNSLIFKYEEILGLLDKNIDKHQILILGIQPISFELLSLIFISIFTYFINLIIDHSTSNLENCQ